MSGGFIPEELERTESRRPSPRLFDVEPDWREHWWDMPHFDQKDVRPVQKIVLNFLTHEDAREAARRLGIRITSKTDTAWFPAEPPESSTANWEYVDG